MAGAMAVMSSPSIKMLPASGASQTDDELQQRRFCRIGSADDDDRFAGLNGQIQPRSTGLSPKDFCRPRISITRYS